MNRKNKQIHLTIRLCDNINTFFKVSKCAPCVLQGRFSTHNQTDVLFGLVVKNVRLESGRSWVRIPFAPGFFRVESYQ